MNRKIAGVGLADEYRHAPLTRRILREVFQLPYLKHEDIPQTFHDINNDVSASDEESKELLQEVMQYIRCNWIDGRWGPHKWSVFKKSIRTNNDTEGWHNGLNTNTNPGRAPSLYKLIEILKTKACDADIETRMVMAGKKIRRERNKSKEKDLAILWKAYEENKITPRMLLREVATMKEVS